LTGHFVLVHFGRWQVDHRQVALAKRFGGGSLDLFAHRFDAPGKILEQNAVLPAVLLHGGGAQGFPVRLPLAHIQTGERAGQHQPVETAHLPLDLVLVLCDKLFHGALLVSSSSVKLESC
jgi:hypothetical protein